jgi:hypothetical protein
LPVLGKVQELRRVFEEYDIEYFAVLFGPRNMGLRKRMYDFSVQCGLKSLTLLLL